MAYLTSKVCRERGSTAELTTLKNLKLGGSQRKESTVHKSNSLQTHTVLLFRRLKVYFYMAVSLVHRYEPKRARNPQHHPHQKIFVAESCCLEVFFYCDLTHLDLARLPTFHVAFTPAGRLQQPQNSIKSLRVGELAVPDVLRVPRLASSAGRIWKGRPKSWQAVSSASSRPRKIVSRI